MTSLPVELTINLDCCRSIGAPECVIKGIERKIRSVVMISAISSAIVFASLAKFEQGSYLVSIRLVSWQATKSDSASMETAGTGRRCIYI